MQAYSNYLVAVLTGTVILSSCSRPVANFQPSPREHFVTASTTAAPIANGETRTAETNRPDSVVQSSKPAVQAKAGLDQVDALVSKNAKLATNKSVHKRLDRIRTLLASSSTKAALAPGSTAAPNKTNLMERLMLKKMNRKINRQLAPAHPEKAMADKHTLVIGAVGVLVGILLLVISTSTFVNVLGIIALAVGLVALLIGLL